MIIFEHFSMESFIKWGVESLWVYGSLIEYEVLKNFVAKI